MRRFVAGTGRTLITFGILLLIFVGYQLWGTGVYTSRAQDTLRSDFLASVGESAPPAFPSTATTRPGAATPTTTTLPPPSVPQGGVLAHLVIPRIGVDTYVVEGIATDDLRRGPGHYPATPLPGQVGNAGIAGHRTTYGAPFSDLDALKVGDEIEITTAQGAFRYLVYEDPFPVGPNDDFVLDPVAEHPAVLTLTTCHPRFSAAQRLIVHASLEVPTGATALPPTPAEGSTVGPQRLSVDADSEVPVLTIVLAALVTAAVGGLWWAWFRRRPCWWVWLIGAVPFLASFLVLCYFVERILPSNY